MKLFCDIHLPASKSESNRALMIAAYGQFAPDFLNLSDSHDTLVLTKAIQCAQQGDSVIDVADCGAAARFLTTYLAIHEGRWLLTGSDRMQQRPMTPLVDALNSLGADIQYYGQKGYLPLFISGRKLIGGTIGLEMSRSSQFASSLLMSAPMFPRGLQLELLGQLSSLPYLDMTLEMMRHFGAVAERDGRKVVVEPKPYQSRPFIVSADWTAASYWYEMAALTSSCEIKIHGLSQASWQGDRVVEDWMKLFGVDTQIENGVAVLRKKPFEKVPLDFDFTYAPDLFPTIAATCAALQFEPRFFGIANLAIKESDRVGAMKTELAKIGVGFESLSENEIVMKSAKQLPFFEGSTPLRFNAHADHRVVMALAPLSLIIGSVSFDQPEVVKKSYPKYWDETSFLAVLRQKNEYLI